MVVRRADGTVIVAGQSHADATASTSDVLGLKAGVGEPPPWLRHLLDLGPQRIVFAHDNAVWTP